MNWFRRLWCRFFHREHHSVYEGEETWCYLCGANWAKRRPRR